MADALDYQAILAEFITDPEGFKVKYGLDTQGPSAEEAAALRNQQSQAASLMDQGNPWARGQGATATSSALGGLAQGIRRLGGSWMGKDATERLGALGKQSQSAASGMERLRLIQKGAEGQRRVSESEAEARARIAAEERKRVKEATDATAANAEWDRRNALTAQQELERARVLAGQKAAEQGREAAKEAGLLEVPGYERPAGAPLIKVEEAQAFRKATAAADTLSKLSAGMRGLKIGADSKEGVGRELFPWTDAAKEIDAAGTAMTLALKELAATGALDQGTIEIANKLIPTRLDDADATKAKLDQFDKFITEKIGSQAGSMSYRKKAGAASPAIERKVLNGKAYEFDGNDWFEVR